MTAQPDRATVARTACILLDMTTDQAAEALRKILDAIRAGLVEQHGWDQAEADAFAARFGNAVVDRLRAMPPARGLH